jgi:hypothetical protein
MVNMDIDPTSNPELYSTESRAPVVIGVVSFLLVTTTATLTLRFYTRHAILNQLGADGWLSLVALVSRSCGTHYISEITY